MLPKVRRALDQLEDVLLEGGQEGKDLASLLSALRGPDEPKYDESKKHTTMPLRSLIFPRLWASSEYHESNKTHRYPSGQDNKGLRGYFPLDQTRGWGMRNPKDLRTSQYVTGTFPDHFISHILDAVEAVERMPSEARGPLNILGDTRE